jgi:hypothetical protein
MHAPVASKVVASPIDAITSGAIGRLRTRDVLVAPVANMTNAISYLHIQVLDMSGEAHVGPWARRHPRRGHAPAAHAALQRFVRGVTTRPHFTAKATNT